jgi:hypothetical protein
MGQRPSPHGPLLAESLSDVLSPHAIRALTRLDVRRDPNQTCTEEELRAALHQRGLPVYQAVVDFERRCGGTFWPVPGTLDRLGTWAALRELEIPGRIYPPKLSIECQGEQLLPISADRGGCNFWMSDRGTVFLSDDIEEDPIADSYTVFLERVALMWGYPEQPDILLDWYHLPIMTEDDFDEIERRERLSDVNYDEPPRRYGEDPMGAFDQRLAEAVGLPLFAPATDRWRHMWFDGQRLLFPYYHWTGDARLIRADSVDEIARIVRAAVEIRPSVVGTWHGPVGEAPRRDEPVIARMQARDLHRDVYGELLFVGTPGNVRVHEVQYDRPISAFRSWKAREETWNARRSDAKNR